MTFLILLLKMAAIAVLGFLLQLCLRSIILQGSFADRDAAKSASDKNLAWAFWGFPIVVLQVYVLSGAVGATVGHHPDCWKWLYYIGFIWISTPFVLWKMFREEASGGVWLFAVLPTYILGISFGSRTPLVGMLCEWLSC
ncbi:MAG: hypothetical protein IT452_21065 [Planctomycetia bacterium]|nr:hypothetical protein [Planctomycetia bacterium]